MRRLKKYFTSFRHRATHMYTMTSHHPAKVAYSMLLTPQEVASTTIHQLSIRLMPGSTMMMRLVIESAMRLSISIGASHHFLAHKPIDVTRSTTSGSYVQLSFY